MEASDTSSNGRNGFWRQVLVGATVGVIVAVLTPYVNELLVWAFTFISPKIATAISSAFSRVGPTWSGAILGIISGAAATWIAVSFSPAYRYYRKTRKKIRFQGSPLIEMWTWKPPPDEIKATIVARDPEPVLPQNTSRDAFDAADRETRRILEWFMSLGPLGVSSNARDLRAVISRAHDELAMDEATVADLVRSMSDRGLIETTTPRYWYEYVTSISNSGRRILEAPSVSSADIKTKPHPELIIELRFGGKDQFGNFVLGRALNIGPVIAKHVRLALPHLPPLRRPELSPGDSFVIKQPFNLSGGGDFGALPAVAEFSDGVQVYRQESIAEFPAFPGTIVRDYQLRKFGPPREVPDFSLSP